MLKGTVFFGTNINFGSHTDWPTRYGVGRFHRGSKYSTESVITLRAAIQRTYELALTSRTWHRWLLEIDKTVDGEEIAARR